MVTAMPSIGHGNIFLQFLTAKKGLLWCSWLCSILKISCGIISVTKMSRVKWS